MTDLPRWSDVLAAALVGTDRSPTPTGSTVEDPAAALLDSAAAVTVYRRAGHRPVTGLAPPVAAPVDPAAVVGAAAAAHLRRLLDQGGPAADGLDAGVRGELLTEWLTAAAQAGRRVPGELLPALLDTGRHRRDLRPLLIAAGGTRAGWLAAQRGAWAYLTEEPDSSAAGDETVWELGTPGQRAGYLAALRGSDPDAARERLAAGWASEAPEERATLLGTLATGLSTPDEEFLEQALDDRRKEIRTLAADLLGRLPGSVYRARMTERARGCVRRDGGTRRLVVRPPERCDKAMQRDGVSLRPPTGVGERAWWLEGLLARTPLQTWVGSPGAPARTPTEFLDLRVPDGWMPVLLRGLARAGADAADPQWAGPLIDALGASGDRPDDALLIDALYPALPEDELMRRAATALGNLGRSTGADRLLELCPRPWPAPLTRAALRALEHFLHRSASLAPLADLSRLAATRLGVDALEKVADLAESVRARPPDNYGRSLVDTLADVLRFRHDMLKELA